MLRKTIICVLLMLMVFSLSFSHAEESYVVYDFTEPEYNWAGENENLDYFAYDDDELAYMGKLYNVNWARRYGGVSIQGNELDLDVSSTQKRFLKMMVRWMRLELKMPLTILLHITGMMRIQRS